MRHHFIGFAFAFQISACFAYEYPISADGLSFTPAAESAAFATVASGMAYAGRIGVKAVVPVFDRPTTVPLSLKIGAEAAKTIGKALITRGPIVAGVAMLAELAMQGIEPGGDTGWQKASNALPSAYEGCWNIFDKCVQNPEEIINQMVEEQNATWPSIQGYYDRIKVGGTETFEVPDLTKGMKWHIWSKVCNIYTLSCSEWVAPHYTLSAIYIKVAPPPKKVPAQPAEIEAAIRSPISDEVANEALKSGIALPVESPTGVSQTVNGVPYVPPGSAVPVMPYATITEGTKPGYLAVDYALGAAVEGDTQTGPTPLPGTTTTTSSGTTTTTSSGAGSGGTTTVTTTTTYTTENNYITNNYPADSTATEEKEYPDLCKDNPDSVACQDMGEAPDEEISKSNHSFSYTPFSIGLPAGCPAPHVVNNLTISYPCDTAQKARPFILGFAYLMGMMMILAAVRS